MAPTMHRFFISPESIRDNKITLLEGVAWQLTQVLRSRPGDRIMVMDNSGSEYLVALETIGSKRVHGTIICKQPSLSEPSTKITLYQGVPKAGRFEFILQKGTELGVSTFVPTFCARSVPRDHGQGWATKRYTRWRRIITEAAEQSHRGRIPVLEDPNTFFRACDKFKGLALIPWEGEGPTSLKTALSQWKNVSRQDYSVSLFIGPEGGFTQGEIEYARAKGVEPVTLGRRILRSETAALASITTVLYELDELET